MSADLYATLGVDRSATADDVKKAYRKRARKAHPDTGGTPAAMTALTLARDVLGDADRRARYDRDGSTDQGTIGEAQRNAMDLIASIYAKLVDQPNALHIDLVSAAKTNLNGMLAGCEAAIQKTQAQVDRYKKLRLRATPKKGPNILGGMLDQRVRDNEKIVGMMEADLVKIRDALVLIVDEKFDPEAVPPVHDTWYQAQVFVHGSGFRGTSTT